MVYSFLKSPEGIDAESTYEDIVSSKGGEFFDTLNQIKSEIFYSYGVYENNVHNFMGIIPLELGEREKSMLRNCYDVRTQSLKKLQKSIQELNKYSLCPYCLLDTPNNIDHYLAKSCFPEYSVFPLNLIWVCPRCNQLKRDKSVSNFLNVYFDEIPDVSFLKYGIHAGGMSFYLDEYVLNGLECKEKIIGSYKVLDLINRYNQQIELLFSSLIESFLDSDCSSLSVKNVCEKEQKKFYCLFGIKNYWKYVFYGAIAENEDLRKFIIEKSEAYKNR